MRFLWYWMLPLLTLIPLLIAAYIWVQHRRTRFALRYSSLQLVKEAANAQSRIRRHIPPLFFVLALAAMLFASARPSMALTTPQQQAVVILTIDTSASMVTTDIHPNRLEAAKAAARSFVERVQNPKPRIGVVAFSGSASLIQAPTMDQQAVYAAIQGLQADTTTAIGSGILTSLDAITNVAGKQPAPAPDPLSSVDGNQAQGTIILLTDGQNDVGPSPLDAAQEAAKRGVRIFTVGIGTSMDLPGQAIFSTTRPDALDEDTLTQIADMTKAKYFRASDETALATIYKNLGTQMFLKTEQTELTPGFVSAAFILILAGHVLGFIWSGRLP